MLIQTSYGQTLMRDLLTRTVSIQFVENVRPVWLFGLELDFYCEALKVGIEFQGGQHYTPVHGLRNLYLQKRRDSKKRMLCKEFGVTLIRVEACDLIAERFRGMIKRAGFGYCLRDKVHSKGFNALAIEYRKRLLESFNCPSARYRRGRLRKEAMKEAFQGLQKDC